MSTGDGWRVLRAAESPPLLRSESSVPVAGRTRAVKPLGMLRCLGLEQRGPWRGLVLKSPARSPGSRIL